MRTFHQVRGTRRHRPRYRMKSRHIFWRAYRDSVVEMVRTGHLERGFISFFDYWIMARKRN